MKYKFFIDKEINVSFAKFEGEITSNILGEYIRESYNDPDWQKNQNSLCDLREADLLLSSDEMNEIVRSYAQDDQANKLAMIVSRDLEFGMSRMFEILTEDKGIWKEYKIFRNITEAKQWLGIEKYTNPGIKWLT